MNGTLAFLILSGIYISKLKYFGPICILYFESSVKEI